MFFDKDMPELFSFNPLNHMIVEEMENQMRKAGYEKFQVWIDDTGTLFVQTTPEKPINQKQFNEMFKKSICNIKKIIKQNS